MYTRTMAVELFWGTCIIDYESCVINSFYSFLWIIGQGQAVQTAGAEKQYGFFSLIYPICSFSFSLWSVG